MQRSEEEYRNLIMIISGHGSMGEFPFSLCFSIFFFLMFYSKHIMPIVNM